MAKKYQINKVTETKVRYLERVVPTNTFVATGTVTCEMWGGGRGTICMDRTVFESDELTKEVVSDNFNDVDFGVAKIVSGRVTVYQVVNVERYPYKGGKPDMSATPDCHEEDVVVMEDMYIKKG